MTAAEIEDYRRQLLGRVRRLSRELSQLEHEALRGVGGEAGGGISDLPLHPADLGTETSEEELDLDLVGNEEQILRECNAALARIEAGTFGRCERCRQEIPKARLQALPYARCCRGCAQRAEAGRP